MATKYGYYKYACYLVVRGTDKTNYLEKYTLIARNTKEARKRLKIRFILGKDYTWVFEVLEYIKENESVNKKIEWERK